MFWIPALILGAITGGAYLLGHKDDAPTGPPPKGTITPERDVIFQTAMATVTDPQNLKDLAASFDKEGLPAQAAALITKANSILAGTPHPNTDKPIDLGNPAPNLTAANSVTPAQAAAQAVAAATAVANGFQPDPQAAAFLNQVISSVSPPTPLSILRIQQIFNQFPQPGLSHLTEDGLPGPQTNTAIGLFQANNGINEAPASRSPGGNIASVGPMTTLAIESLAQPTAFEIDPISIT